MATSQLTQLRGLAEANCLDLYYYETQQSVKVADIVLFFSNFCQQITQPTVVVLDNASCHRSAEVQAHLAEWEEHGLRLFFLPPYSPELNRIEVLWRCCKHHWLSLAAYTSFHRLQDELQKILNKVGNECKINFA